MTKYVNNNGVSEMWLNIKNWVTSQLLGKSNTGHTHTTSDVTGLSTILDGKLDVTDVFATWNYSNGNLEIPNVYSSDIDSSLSTTSENPVQNKVINSALDGKIPLAGTNALSGSIVPDANNSYDFGSSTYKLRYVYANTAYFTDLNIADDIDILSSAINKKSNSGRLALRGGTSFSNGASVILYGKDYIDGTAGRVELTAYGSSDYTQLTVLPNGTMSVNTNGTVKNVAMQENTVPRSGGAVMTGTQLGRDADNSYLVICGGTLWNSGASLALNSKGSSNAGMIELYLKDTSNIKSMKLYPNGTWTWNGSSVQITSDQRYKQQITEIDDKLLDAWEDVTLVQFKYNDAVDAKKNKARLHTGYVVQQIDEACQKHNIDISEYGLYCHEEYPERTEEVTIENEDGTIKKETKVIEEASEHYSLRYTETLVVECAYLRKKNKELQEQLDKVIARLDNLEKGDNVK